MKPSALARRINRLIAKWIPILGLENWGITVRYDEPKAKATCDVEYSYEEATVNFNLKRIATEIPNKMAAHEELVVHELVHCLVAPYDSEKRVSRVTRSILRARGMKGVLHAKP